MDVDECCGVSPAGDELVDLPAGHRGAPATEERWCGPRKATGQLGPGNRPRGLEGKVLPAEFGIWVGVHGASPHGEVLESAEANLSARRQGHRRHIAGFGGVFEALQRILVVA